MTLFTIAKASILVKVKIIRLFRVVPFLSLTFILLQELAKLY